MLQVLHIIFNDPNHVTYLVAREEVDYLRLDVGALDHAVEHLDRCQGMLGKRDVEADKPIERKKSMAYIYQRLQLSRFGWEISRFEANFPKSPAWVWFSPAQVVCTPACFSYQTIIICWIKCSQNKAEIGPRPKGTSHSWCALCAHFSLFWKCPVWKVVQAGESPV